MVVLEGQDIIGSLLRNGLGNVCVPPHSVDSDQGALKLPHPQQLGNRRNVVGRVINFELAYDKPMSVGPGAYDVDSACGAGLIKGAAQPGRAHTLP